MSVQRRVCWIAVCAAMAIRLSANAQETGISVAYLRATVSALRDNESVTVKGIFMSNPGLEQPTGWNLRRQPICRFAVKDTQTGVVFSSMYCRLDSSAFTDLIAATTPRAFFFKGHRDDGENNEPAIFVTAVQPCTEKIVVSEGTAPTSFRVTITDNATRNRTVLANVALGQAYSVGGMTVVVEQDTSSPSAQVNVSPPAARPAPPVSTAY